MCEALPAIIVQDLSSNPQSPCNGGHTACNSPCNVDLNPSTLINRKQSTGFWEVDRRSLKSQLAWYSHQRTMTNSVSGENRTDIQIYPLTSTSTLLYMHVHIHTYTVHKSRTHTHYINTDIQPTHTENSYKLNGVNSDCNH